MSRQMVFIGHMKQQEFQWKYQSQPVMCATLNLMFLCFLKQTLMPTARPPVCLLPSLPVTATSRTTVLTSSPSRGALRPPSSPSWTARTGKGTAAFSFSSWCLKAEWGVCLTALCLLHLQAEGVLRDRLQGPVRRGDHRSQALQALLQHQETEDTGVHNTSGHTSPRHASSSAPRRHERNLVIAFCCIWYSLEIVSSGRPSYFDTSIMLDSSLLFLYGMFLFFIYGYFWFLYRVAFLFYRKQKNWRKKNQPDNGH